MLRFVFFCLFLLAVGRGEELHEEALVANLRGLPRDPERTPIKPVEPVKKPVKIDKHVEPVKKTGKVEPVKKSVEPVKPVKPVEPVKKPVEPVKPVKPVEPVKPVKPVKPVEPVKPSSSECTGAKPDKACGAGLKMECVNKQWKCASSLTGQDGDPIIGSSCGPSTIKCTRGFESVCQPDGSWSCVSVSKQPVVKPVTPAAPGLSCGVLRMLCVRGKSAKCDTATGKWACVAPADPPIAIDPVATTSGCGPSTVKCASGYASMCTAGGKWACVPQGRPPIPVVDPPVAVDPLPSLSCGPNTVRCSAGHSPVCTPAGTWTCGKPTPAPVDPPIAIDPPIVVDPVAPSKCGPSTVRCSAGHSAVCTPAGTWTCMTPVDTPRPLPPVIDPAPEPAPAPAPVSTAGPALPAASATWAAVPDAAANPSVSAVAAFASATVNAANAVPAGGGMGMTMTVTTTASARTVSAGTGGVLWELVSGVTRAPNCPPGSACPMFIMCGEQYFLVFEDASQQLSLVGQHAVSEAGCLEQGTTAPLSSAAVASLASNWAPVNLDPTGSALGTIIALAQWASNPLHLMGVSHTVTKVLSARVQVVPSLGTNYQITAQITSAPVVYKPKNTCSVHSFFVTVNSDSSSAVAPAAGAPVPLSGFAPQSANQLWQNTDTGLSC